MNNKRLIGGMLSAALLAAPALGHAQQPHTGWYVGGGVGYSKLKFDNADFQQGIVGLNESKDDKDTGFKAFAGYQFTPSLGVELGYAKIGEFAYRYEAGAAGGMRLDYEVEAWTLAGTGRVPLGPVSLLGKLGFSRNSADLTMGSATGPIGAALTAAGLGPGANAEKTKTSIYWGVGAQFDINRTFGLRLEYENFGKFGNEEDTGRAKADMFSVNAVVRF